MAVLRARSGLSVRHLARASGVESGTLSGWLTGRHLPNPSQLSSLQSVLAALGLDDPREAALWVDAFGRLRSTTDGRSGRGSSPYRGLEPFREEDADVYFGRRQVTKEVLALVSGLPGPGMVALVGASGSGKSSLLRAGLVPALRAGDASGGQVAVHVMSADQLDEGVLDLGSDGSAVVIVDRIEDVLVAAEPHRRERLDRLEELGRRCRVVVAVRADFYDDAASEVALIDALRHRQVLVTPMTTEELREVIVGPAEAVGAGVEGALVDLVLSDLRTGDPGGFAHEPGVLPLLSYALLAAWESGSRNQLTVADYVTVGGISGAVLQAAEQLYSALDSPEQQVARALFSRLVRVDGGARPTRARVDRREMLDTGHPSHDEIAGRVLERFVAARLVTVDSGAIQLSHEALLVAWPRLARWVEADREWLHLHHQLADAARAWDGSGRHGSMLWRGPRLAGAVEAATTPGRSLNRVEEEFVSRSREEEHREHRRERLHTRRTHRLLAALAAVTAAALAAAAVAVVSTRQAQRTRDQAMSREVAIEARQLSGSDPAVAAQLAVAAYRLAPTVQARSALLDASAADIPTRITGPAGPQFVARSADGSLLAIARTGDDTVALLNPSSPAHIAGRVAAPPGGKDFAVALRADGALLAVGGDTGTVELVDVRRPAAPAPVTSIRVAPTTIYALAFSPGGGHLAAAGADGKVHLYDISDAALPRAVGVLAGQGGAFKAAVWLPDGSLAAVGAGGNADIWLHAAGRPFALPGAGTSDLEALAVSPDGTRLLAGASDGSLHLWNLTKANAPSLAPAPARDVTAPIDSVAFSSNGAYLAAGTADGSLRAYHSSTLTVASIEQAPYPVTGVAFAAGDSRLVAVDSGGGVQTWTLPLAGMLDEPGNVFGLGFATDGRLAATSDGGAGDVTLWAPSAGIRPDVRSEVHLPAALGPVAGAGAIRPDGRLLAAANRAGAVQLFDVTDPAHPEAVGAPLTGGHPLVEDLAFSPTGNRLVATDDAGDLLTWDVTDPAHPRAMPTRHDTAGEILSATFDRGGHLLATTSSDNDVRLYRIEGGGTRLLATLGGFTNYAYTAVFTPGDRTLIAGSADGTVRLWNVADPTHPVLLGRPLSGPTGYVYQLALSPDGSTLAAASTDHSVWLWNVADRSAPSLLATLSAAGGAVFAVTYRPDGSALLASGSDQIVHVWASTAKQAATAICATAGSPVSRADWSRYVQGEPYHPPCPGT
ncbi:helix-turn-helix domain-containing protein [Acidiferrimicrobium sp. IK]|uniref:nSTAND1 domain-containing NTPase n=1 Tax=Acidiferrimicrobium sp. IK TaxID=2871700 RepID=UPI0021CAFD75|nr:helix-turn-helix domain-containing protein [Acidiferrimicrobium sp. IK]MCU4185611.1 helix-turn-helix domain-containing protein [Acidiferrimicrobium sp. IK]